MARPPLAARPPTDAAEGRTLRKLANARHAPASLIQRARIITASWDGASVPELAAEGIQVGRSQVRRILISERVRWRRTRSWATSTDPDFAPKERRSSPSTPARPRQPR